MAPIKIRLFCGELSTALPRARRLPQHHKFDLPQAKYRLVTLPRAYAAYSGTSIQSSQFNRAQVLLDRGADAAGKIRGKILSLRPKNCFQNTDTCVNL